ncbi:MAG: MoxR-like ATPase [Verrucomicrobia bacterium]|jgi:MoxR-like ATPase|nr:MAG: MoxR-like ATPase [Verrucomicrobiota bacterium]
MPTIQFLEGSLQGQSFELDSRGATLGSNDRCELQVADEGVSPKHLSLHHERGHWVLRDLRSKHGTTVNQQPVRETLLGHGDVVRLGAAAFRFRLGAAETMPPPAATTLRAALQQESPPQSELTAGDKATIDELRATYERLVAEISQVIVGQHDVIEEVLMAIFCKSHALLVGVPGLAKTLLVSTISNVLDLTFKRIQFTPDLMPADITGTEVLEEDRTTGGRAYRFVHGPIFANMVLADEINRTPPKTQAALLEAMQERHVTIGEVTHELPSPFFVLATQNPIEQEGTYPLPEAQLDRFIFNIRVGYPTAEEEQLIIKRVTSTYMAKPRRQLTAEDVIRLQEVVRRVPVADGVVAYAASLARATRPKQPEAPDFVREMVSWGAGPRAGIYLVLAAKARAILQGRYHVTTGDIQAVAYPVLRHRVLTTFNAEAAGVSSDDIIRMLIEQQRLPGVKGV